MKRKENLGGRWNNICNFFLIYILMCMASVLVSCAGKPRTWTNTEHDLSNDRYIERTFFALDTVVNIKLYGVEDESLLDKAEQICHYYEGIFSAHDAASKLYQINHRLPGTSEVFVDEDLAKVIQKGLHYSTLSEGAFDITMLPVQNLWDFTAENPILPSDDALVKSLQNVGYQHLTLDENILHFANDYVMLDLGAIAKGYIADVIKEELVQGGVQSAIINLGGNILCIGKKLNHQDFVIGLNMPDKEKGELAGYVKVNDQSVVSSGVYERHFVIDGKNYHHILDSKTGYPVQNGLVQVSILAKNSVDADALSTLCFVLGVEQAKNIVESMEDTYAFFLKEDGSMEYSKGAREQMVVSSK